MVEALKLTWRAPIATLFSSGRICGVVAAETAAEVVHQIKLAIGSSRRVHNLELRLDFLRNAEEREALLRWLSRHWRGAASQPPTIGRRTFARETMLIATCRTRRGGGKFGGSASMELTILGQAARAGCGWCDVEIETAKQFDPADLRRAVAPAYLMVSMHDFRCLPPNLPRLVKQLDRYAAQAIKIAAVCRSLSAARRLFRVTHARRDVVTIPMGEQALAARMLALREGGALTYASIARSTAPGQLSLEAMRNVYRWDRRFGASTNGPTRRTKIYGVIGNPVTHSLSPLMHNTAFADRGLDALYLPFEVHDLGDFVRSAAPLGIAGFSVTIPHKQAILRYLDGYDPLAAEIGAVNTVLLRGKRLYGYNTDYVGVLQALEKHVPLDSSRVLLVGAGGAARAAAFALAHRGATVAIWARRPAQAEELARAAGAQAIDRQALRRESFDAIVNCTPVGLHAGTHAGTSAEKHARKGTGVASPLEADELNCRIVMEMIYRPRTTPLLRLAKRKGIATISGVEMFLAQGAAQYEIWTGKRAPEGAMRKAVLTALQTEERTSARRRAK